MAMLAPARNLLVIGAVGALGAFGGLAATTLQVSAESNAPWPDFSANDAAWVSSTRDYLPVPGEPGPTHGDPAHPYVPNNVGAQPSFRIADLTNPNIKPWAKEIMRRANERVLAGGIGYAARASCMPAGVPDFVMYAVFESIHFLQTPKQVTIIFSGDAQVRRVYLDVPHSQNPKPSWYGESVGHYEGDTLVIDTIGMNDRTFVDNYNTPHTEKLHVVERWRMTDGGQTMEVKFTVEDPDTFYAPWTAIHRFRRVERPMHEEACAENNTPLFDYHTPTAEKADF